MTPAPDLGLVPALKAALSIPVLAFLPGYLILGLARSSEGRRPVLGAFERILMGMVLSLALTSVLSLLLAQAGRFDIDFVAMILVGASALVWRLSPRHKPEREGRADGGPEAQRHRHAEPELLTKRPRGSESEPHPPSGPTRGEPADRLSLILLGAVVVLAAVAFTPPFQTTLWAGDSTLYVAYGVQIGRSGSYVFEDPLLGGIPLDTREELFRNQADKDKTGRYARFPGGIGFVDLESGTVAPGFSPLFPVWVAIFAQLFGAAQVFWVSSFFGICAVAALFCLGRALDSPSAGFFASLWLLACMPQIWFSRMPMSETLSQIFLLGGLWMAILYLRTENRVVGGVAGFVFGVAGLTGFDVVVTATAGIFAFAAVVLWAGRRIENAQYFVAAYSAVLLYGIVHLVHYPSHVSAFFEERLPRLPYGNVFVSILEITAPEVWLTLTVGFLVVSVVGFILLTNRLIASAQTRRRLAAVMLGTVVALYLTAYVLSSLPRYRDTPQWFPAYLSWPLMALFVFSLVGIVVRRVVVAPHADTIALLAGFAVASLPVIYNPQLQDFDVHIGTMRRFVPFVIPGICLIGAIGFAWFARRLSPRARWIAAPAGVVLLLFLVARPSAAIVGGRLWDDGVLEGSELAAMFPAGSIVLVTPELVGVQAQAALTFWNGLGGVALNRTYAVEGLVEDQVARWLRNEREVFLLSATPELHFAGSPLVLSEHASDELAVRTLAPLPWPPREPENRQVRITAYRFGLDPTPKTYVDVGTYASDALFPLAGFYGVETDPVSGSYRWAGAVASIEVPAARRVTLVLQGARPSSLAPAVVSIRANGRLIVENTTIRNEPTAVVLDLTDLDDTGAVTISIESSTFNPRSAGLSDDDRDLGVRLYRADFER